MSEELEWELFEIFENALFAFPIYDHKSARQIVRYLLRRGVLEEEIADAIEDSTIDLMIWLNRGGKHMVGEWVISWVNDTRDEYLREVEIERLHLEELSRDVTPGLSSATTESSGDTEDCASQTTAVAEACAPPLPLPLPPPRIDVPPDDGDDDESTEHSDGDTPPPPPRTLRRKWSRKGKEPPAALHLDPDAVDGDSLPTPPTPSEVARHHSPSSSETEEGATGSSLSSTSSSGSVLSDIDGGVTTAVVTQADHNQNQKCTNCTLAVGEVFRVDQNGLPIKSQCTCTLAHYSYIKQLRQAELDAEEEEDDEEADQRSDRALEINVDTLDKDGPGFIFIMTDSLRECMPWSAESRYKVASSRRPERCLLEFRSRNVDIDLIWQVKVEHHVMAVKEVHTTLDKYNLHSNWFRCSLSEIMEAISRVIKKYKHK